MPPRKIEGSGRTTQLTKRQLFDKWFTDEVQILDPRDPRSGHSQPTARFYEEYLSWLGELTTGGWVVADFSLVGFAMALTHKGYRAHKNNDHSIRRGLWMRVWDE